MGAVSLTLSLLHLCLLAANVKAELTSHARQPPLTPTPATRPVGWLAVRSTGLLNSRGRFLPASGAPTGSWIRAAFTTRPRPVYWLLHRFKTPIHRTRAGIVTFNGTSETSGTRVLRSLSLPSGRRGPGTLLEERIGTEVFEEATPTLFRSPSSSRDNSRNEYRGAA